MPTRNRSSIPLRSRVEVGGLQGSLYRPHRVAAVSLLLDALVIRLFLVSENLRHPLAELGAPSGGRVLPLKQCLKSVP